MEQSYDKLFSTLPRLHAPSGVNERILLSIYIHEKRRMRVTFALCATTALASLATLFSLAESTLARATESGLPDYLALLQSDSDVVLSHWQDFALTLVDALPLLGITLMLLMLFTLLHALRIALSATQQPFKQYFFSL
jgi:hypothetical protein